MVVGEPLPIAHLFAIGLRIYRKRRLLQRQFLVGWPQPSNKYLGVAFLNSGARPQGQGDTRQKSPAVNKVLI
jgi:hypothetical protein